MTFHVHLSEMSMFDTLQVAATMHFTGHITIVSKSKMARLSLLRGRVVSASVDGVSKVGVRLIKARAISRADLQAVLERQVKSESAYPVGLLASIMGVADSAEVNPVVVSQLRDACAAILRWTSGSVDFDPDHDLESLESHHPQVEISGLLLHAAHLLDIEGYLSNADDAAAPSVESIPVGDFDAELEAECDLDFEMGTNATDDDCTSTEASPTRDRA